MTERSSKDLEPSKVLEFSLGQFLTVGAPVKPPWLRFSSRGNTSDCFPMRRRRSAIQPH